MLLDLKNVHFIGLLTNLKNFLIHLVQNPVIILLSFILFLSLGYCVICYWQTTAGRILFKFTSCNCFWRILTESWRCSLQFLKSSGSDSSSLSDPSNSFITTKPNIYWSVYSVVHLTTILCRVQVSVSFCLLRRLSACHYQNK